MVEEQKEAEEVKKEQEALEKLGSQKFNIESWNPKTNLGKLVKEGKINSI